ncbi:MAG: metal-sulfur cluster assembly factor [Candidatus Woesearchaeota archaeon]|jgi:metal-sulfur cluster biosynthetic enzyme|nr:metal-sulfur cluster assembly factor [Candidatus Woesearchaeota archaeon]MDP7324300.1 metal-sulfur cluster assembly factor [Candidatus Woesearchaeota archaeon]MDP7457801.1 metal-sulfur cluster assembly factor [Candidatus Woesearchaeota archaeon]
MSEGNLIAKSKLESIEKNKKIIEALKKIEDPELQLDIWTLGLIYNISYPNDKVTITMTFTSPTCPYAPQLMAQVGYVIKELGIKMNDIEITFDPPWEPTEEVKDLLGLA